MMTQQTTLYLQGMSCQLCAKRIEESLRHVSGVSSAHVDFGARRAAVVFDPASVTPELLCAAVRTAGYDASPLPPGRQLGRLALKLGILWCLYFLLEHFGILNLLVPSQLADSSMGYGMLFVTGLLTSVHCVAMCGGIGLSQSMAGVKRASLGPILQYHLGRVLSYVTLGTVLGGIGSLAGSFGGLSYGFQGGLKLLAGTVMLGMGLNMLELLPKSPGLPGIRLRRPKGLSPFGVGLINGFMPCGPLQSMLLLALASESPLRGGLSMLCFSLGTLPLLLGFGSLATWMGKRFTHAVLTAGAVLIAVFGLSMLSQGVSLTGLFTPKVLLPVAGWLCLALFLWKLPLSAPKRMSIVCGCLVLLLAFSLWSPKKEASNAARMEGDTQIVETTLESGSYADIRVAAGIPVKWVIHADEEEINGCNNQFLCRAFGLDVTFHPGENLVEFLPSQPGVYPYSCWMGMIHGTIIVE